MTTFFKLTYPSNYYLLVEHMLDIVEMLLVFHGGLAKPVWMSKYNTQKNMDVITYTRIDICWYSPIFPWSKMALV